MFTLRKVLSWSTVVWLGSLPVLEFHRGREGDEEGVGRPGTVDVLHQPFVFLEPHVLGSPRHAPADAVTAPQMRVSVIDAIGKKRLDLTPVKLVVNFVYGRA